MNWDTLLIPKRKYESSKNSLKEDVRSPFLKDVDKITFSSYFRKLQDKTQVYPLAKSSYLRTRLTHSLEVATVGRSLGNIIGKTIIEKYNLKNVYKDITFYDFGYIIQAAALAHDIGNPPFGHSGENAICSFYLKFLDNYSSFNNSYNNIPLPTKLIKDIHELYAKNQIADFINFDGNAQGFKIITTLSKEFECSTQDNYTGLNLTYPVLATVCKYPNFIKNRDFISTKKLGIFNSEKKILENIISTLNIKSTTLEIKPHKVDITYRHPLTFLLEAADDICYLTSDLCDAFSVDILEYDEILDLFSNIIVAEESKFILNKNGYYNFLQEKLNHYMSSVFTSPESKITKNILAQNIESLTSEVINILILLTAENFLKNEKEILNGTFNQSLLESIKTIKESIEKIRVVSENKIYSATEKLTQEIKGSVAITHLLEEFIKIVINLYTEKQPITSYLLNKLYFQENIKRENGLYNNLQLINNFIVSCTDKKIIEVFHNVKGS